jgi:two-component system sensor histidine kinase PilS (NtrC family)
MTLVLDPPEETTALELMTMFLNSGTLLVIAIVAGGLAERFHAARAELEAKRRALDDLQVFKDLVFQSVETGLVAIDRRHRITAFNRAAAEMTGVSAADAMGRTWSSLFGDALPLGVVEAALDAQPRATSRHQLALARPDGTTAPLRIAFSALRSADGGRLGLIAACEDLTTLRALESRMRQADRLATLGRMAANIAHEIRNPLASMTGAIEVLVGAERPPEMRDRLASIVLRESARLNEIIKGFLEYARPAPLVLAAADVAESLDEILVLIEHRAAPGSLKIVREFSSPLTVTVDPQQFRQAIWNLCLNAVQAMPEGGELRVGASVHDGRLEVRVTDTGEGIALDDLPHVFEPFFSTKDQGTGLGLALVHRIVQDHGGEVEVQSVPGAGTTFVVGLPVPHA